MPITPSAGQTVNVYAGLTGVLPVSVSGNVTISGTVAVSQTNQQGMTSAAPVWVTGVLTKNNTGVGITASITLPVSATNPVTASISNFPTGFNTNITQSIVLPVSMTNAITATLAGGGLNVNVTQSVPLVVTSTFGSPVWVTGSTGGSSEVNITGSIPLTASISGATFTSGGLEVFVVNQTSSSLSGVGITSGALDVWVQNSQGSNVNITASIPIQVTSTLADPVWVTGNLGITTGQTSIWVDAGQASDTGSLVSRPYSTTSTVLLSGNISRAGLSVYNDADRELFISVDSLVTTQSFSYRVAQRAQFELPPPLYRGAVWAVWASGGAGQALVTEYTANPVISGSIYVTSTLAQPLYVTGAFSFVPTAPTGTTPIAGDVAITASIPLFVTSTQANPVWVTGALLVNTGTSGGGLVEITASVPLTVTSTLSQPLWVTGSTGGSSEVNITASVTLFVSSTQANPVWITGSATVNTGTSGGGLVEITASVPLAVTASLTNPVGVTGSVFVLNPGAAAAATTGTIYSVTATGTVGGIGLLASNSNRKLATVFNNASTNLYVSLGTGATTASFQVILIPNAYYEVLNFTGAVSGAWTGTPVGNALVGENT